MNQLSTEKRAAVIAAMVEGNSLRGTARMTGVARMTIEKLLREIGAACARYQDEHLRNLKTRRVQADEIWSFCYAKAKNVTPEIREQHPDAGDIWTWTAIDADSKLVLSFMVGPRNLNTAYAFMEDVASRLANRVQLTTDAFTKYLHAVDNAFVGEVDYAQLQKIYSGEPTARYSPPKCVGTKTMAVYGDPNPKHISTSFVERQNLTMRMSMRRFTRLTNAFSKKVEMHAHAVALHFMYYNFCKIHGSLRVTPAMEAGLADRPWEIQDLIALLEPAYQTQSA